MKCVYLFLLVLGFAHLATATTVEKLSIDDLVNKADRIVIGEVLDRHSYWTPDRKLILTSQRIRVAETLKGAKDEELVITTLGGTVGNSTMHVAGVPTFRAGEIVAVFAEAVDASFTVLGLNQGKFNVTAGAVQNSIVGLDFTDGKSSSPIRLSIEEFKALVGSKRTSK